MIVESYYVLEVATMLGALAFSCVLFAWDPGQRINRRMALIPALVALWSIGEIVWNQQSTPEGADMVVRWTAVSWLFLGPACLHLYAEVAGGRQPAARRLVPFSYLASFVVSAMYVTTDFGIVYVYPVPWGHGFELAPSFLALYAVASAPVGYILVTARDLFPRQGMDDERRSWRKTYVAILGSLIFATIIELVLPVLGLRCPPVGSLGILLMAFTLARQFKRHGYSLMAPSAFAPEILEALGEGVVMLRANGRIRIANSTFERMVGVQGAALRGMRFSRFAPTLSVDPRKIGEDIECDLVHADGAAFRVSISPTRLPNPSGNARGVALLIRDLREVTALRGSLVASDRLAMVGGLSASISEEIREPIEKVRSHLEGMRARLETLRDLAAELPDDDKLDMLVTDRDELLEECLEGVARVESIVRDVRGFASGQSGPREFVDPNRLIEDALRIAVARADREVRFEKRLEELDPIACCPGEIVQVLVNLLVNAIHATEEGGQVELSSFFNAGEVWICIEDDGSGIPPEVMSRIFDPFFTTKPVGDGTGLGLAISLHIVHNHGGDLRVESEDRRGSRFTLALPTDPKLPVARGAAGGVLSG